MSEVEEFEKQLPYLIKAWSTAMRCGYSLTQSINATAAMERTQQPFDINGEFTALQAVEAVPYDAVNPAAAQFAQVVQDAQNSGSLLTALDQLQERLPGRDVKTVIDTIKAHREVGGNLADILEILSMVLQKE